MTIGNQPPGGHLRRGRPRAHGPAPDRDHARGPEVGRGVVHDPVRRHAGAVRGHDRGPRPAAPPGQGHGLGHRHLRDAAAGDGRALRARVREGQDRRTDARDPAPGRAVAARRRGPVAARGADGDRRLRRHRRRRRDAHGVDHRRLRRPRGRADHLRHGPPPRRPRGRRVGRHHRRLASCSTSTTPRTRTPRSTSTSSAPTPARTSSSRARPRASRSTGRRSTSCSTSRTPASGGCSRRSRPRWPPSAADRGTTRRAARAAAPARRDALPAQAARAARAARRGRRRRARLARRRGHPRRARGDRRDVRDQRPAEGPLLRRAAPACRRSPTTPASRSMRWAAAPGVRTRRYAGPGRDRRRRTTPSCWPRSAGRPADGAARATCACWRSRSRAMPARATASRTIVRRGTCRGRIATAPEGRRRLRLRPDLRARPGAPGRPDAGRVVRGREERDLAPLARGPPDGPVLRELGF